MLELRLENVTKDFNLARSGKAKSFEERAQEMASVLALSNSLRQDTGGVPSVLSNDRRIAEGDHELSIEELDKWLSELRLAFGYDEEPIGGVSAPSFDASSSPVPPLFKPSKERNKQKVQHETDTAAMRDRKLLRYDMETLLQIKNTPYCAWVKDVVKHKLADRH